MVEVQPASSPLSFQHFLVFVSVLSCCSVRSFVDFLSTTLALLCTTQTSFLLHTVNMYNFCLVWTSTMLLLSQVSTELMTLKTTSASATTGLPTLFSLLGSARRTRSNSPFQTVMWPFYFLFLSNVMLQIHAAAASESMNSNCLREVYFHSDFYGGFISTWLAYV